MTGIDKAIQKAGSHAAFGEAIGTSAAFVTQSRRRGWLPLQRAQIAAELYGIPLVDLVRKDIAAALRAQS